MDASPAFLPLGNIDNDVVDFQHMLAQQRLTYLVPVTAERRVLDVLSGAKPHMLLKAT